MISIQDTFPTPIDFTCFRIRTQLYYCSRHLFPIKARVPLRGAYILSHCRSRNLWQNVSTNHCIFVDSRQHGWVVIIHIFELKNARISEHSKWSDFSLLLYSFHYNNFNQSINQSVYFETRRLIKNHASARGETRYWKERVQSTKM